VLANFYEPFGSETGCEWSDRVWEATPPVLCFKSFHPEFFKLDIHKGLHNQHLTLYGLNPLEPSDSIPLCAFLSPAWHVQPRSSFRYSFLAISIEKTLIFLFRRLEIEKRCVKFQMGDGTPWRTWQPKLAWCPSGQGARRAKPSYQAFPPHLHPKAWTENPIWTFESGSSATVGPLGCHHETT